MQFVGSVHRGIAYSSVLIYRRLCYGPGTSSGGGGGRGVCVAEVTLRIHMYAVVNTRFEHNAFETPPPLSQFFFRWTLYSHDELKSPVLALSRITYEPRSSSTDYVLVGVHIERYSMQTSFIRLSGVRQALCYTTERAARVQHRRYSRTTRNISMGREPIGSLACRYRQSITNGLIGSAERVKARSTPRARPTAREHCFASQPTDRTPLSPVTAVKHRPLVEIIFATG